MKRAETAMNVMENEDVPLSSLDDASPPPRAPERPRALQLVARWLKENLRSRTPESTLKEAIEEIIEEHEEEATDAFAPEEKEMLRNMLSLSDLTVHDIMVPRAQITAVEDTITLDALREHIMEHGHTRIPVYEANLDTIKGFVHVKDLVNMLAGAVPYNLEEVQRQILFVPPSMRILDLLMKMRLSGVHMAIVVDEYGGTDGLVTLEDLFEEIVGDIQDEHDELEPEVMILHVSDRVLDMDARVSVETLDKDFGVNLRDEDAEADFDTVGGFIFYQLGRVPARGEVVIHESTGTKLEVLDADPRRIHKVRVTLPVAAPSVGDA